MATSQRISVSRNYLGQKLGDDLVIHNGFPAHQSVYIGFTDEQWLAIQTAWDLIIAQEKNDKITVQTMFVEAANALTQTILTGGNDGKASS